MTTIPKGFYYEVDTWLSFSELVQLGNKIGRFHLEGFTWDWSTVELFTESPALTPSIQIIFNLIMNILNLTTDILNSIMNVNN